MKHIALLSCLNASKVCTGASCFRAFYERTASFKEYENEELYLDAFMKCNGCGINPQTDAGMLEKIERLKKIGIQIVHIGICTKQKDDQECNTITTIVQMIEQLGIQVVRGTH